MGFTHSDSFFDNLQLQKEYIKILNSSKNPFIHIVFVSEISVFSIPVDLSSGFVISSNDSIINGNLLKIQLT